MQRLHVTSKSTGAMRCAEDVMGAIPQVVWFMRRRMRGNRGKLSLAQFRSLVRVEREPSVSVTEIAEHVGTSLSTTSRVVSGLVVRALLARTTSRVDRRKVSVRITEKGQRVLQSAREATRRELEKVFSELDDSDQFILRDAMKILHRLFRFPEEPQTESNGNARAR